MSTTITHTIFLSQFQLQRSAWPRTVLAEHLWVHCLPRECQSETLRLPRRIPSTAREFGEPGSRGWAPPQKREGCLPHLWLMYLLSIWCTRWVLPAASSTAVWGPPAPRRPSPRRGQCCSAGVKCGRASGTCLTITFFSSLSPPLFSSSSSSTLLSPPPSCWSTQ